MHAGNASEHVLKAQPETKAMMELILERGYTLSVALDGGALVATYPYDRPVQPGNVSLLQISVKSTFTELNHVYWRALCMCDIGPLRFRPKSLFLEQHQPD